LASQDEIQKLVREGVEAARAGDTDKARQIFQDVTDKDINNERAWLWLATVTDDPEEKRIYIENVLHINPDNDRAQQMLIQLEGKETQAKARDSELVPGVSRGRAILIGGGSVGIWLVLMILLVVIGVNRRSTFQAQIAATQQAVDAASTEVAQVSTDQFNTAVAITETADAVLTATAEADATEGGGGGVPGVPTLPPTWTPVPTVGGVGVTTATPLAAIPVEDLQGHILVGWGTRDQNPTGFYPAFGYQLGDGSEIRLGDFRVQDIEINPASGQEITYTRYYGATSDFGIEIANLNGTAAQRLADAWEPIDFILNLEQVSFSPDGSKVTFIAPAAEEGTDREVWFLDLDAPPVPGESPLRRMTNDDANYEQPAISPDNTQIVAIKRDPQSLDPGPDIVVIQIDGGAQQPVKEDGSRTLESDPTWVLPEGREIAYTGLVEGEGATQDIIRLNLANPGAPAQFLVRNVDFNASHPVFSPGGQYMAYASDQTGTYNIFILHIPTGETFQLTNDNDGPNFPGSWFEPGILAERGRTIIPTPIVLEEEEGEGS
jgi:hypothetical protein